MARVALSYRRADTAAQTGRLYDRLVQVLGAERVFMDVDSIRLGDDFVEAIEGAVDRADVLIVVIGKGWLSDEGGERKIDDPHDFVRLEVGAALRTGKRIIPVLVNGATMPAARELPEDLRALHTRQALSLSDHRFHSDVDQLVESLGAVRAGSRPQGALRAAAGSTGAARERVTGDATDVPPPPGMPGPAASFVSRFLGLAGWALVVFGVLGAIGSWEDLSAPDTGPIDLITFIFALGLFLGLGGLLIWVVRRRERSLSATRTLHALLSTRSEFTRHDAERVAKCRIRDFEGQVAAMAHRLGRRIRIEGLGKDLRVSIDADDA